MHHEPIRAFAAGQLRRAQAPLRGILLVYEEEDVVKVVLRQPLTELSDNPANTSYSWSFSKICVTDIFDNLVTR
jgi:hypothetical protein